MGELVRLFLAVFLFSAVSGGVLATVKNGTEDRIKEQQLKFEIGPAIQSIFESAENDPLKDLFVIKDGESDVDDETFIQSQIETLQNYLGQFPAEERGERALAWIEAHAENYRREWQRRILTDQASVIRCRDCPLANGDSSDTCEIHDAWLELLNSYIAGDIDSRRYVERSLKLLQGNKQRLKVHYGFERTAASGL